MMTQAENLASSKNPRRSYEMTQMTMMTQNRPNKRGGMRTFRCHVTGAHGARICDALVTPASSRLIACRSTSSARLPVERPQPATRSDTDSATNGRQTWASNGP